MAAPKTARRSAGARALAAIAAGALGAAAVLAMPSNAGADEDFIVGSGRADARILRVGPAAGQLALAPTLGLSLADFLGTLGRGEARVADWAALDDSVAAVKPYMPEVRTQSTEENAEAGKSTTFLGTPAGTPVTLGVMEQRSAASAAPKGTSEVTLGAVGIPGVIEIGASKASSTAQVIEKKAREARGVTSIASLSLGGGVVVLKGLTWEAVQRTGEGAKVDGSFRVDGLTVAGQNVTIPSNGSELAAVLPQINAALAPSGLVLDPPTVQREADIARVSPLGIRIVNSQLGQTAVAPVVGGLQPVREPVTGAVIENCEECKAAILVADVVAGVITGGGRLDIELGGATGFTEGTRYESPFNFNFAGIGGGASSDFGGGDFGAESFGDAGSSPSSFETASGGAALGSPSAALGSTAGAPAPAPAPGVGTESATGTLATSSRGVTGSTGGAAALIGLVGLLGAVALGGADFRAIRAARRTIPTA